MGNASTFVRKLQTGNLPSAVASSAKVYVKLDETKEWKPTEGNRFCFVGFKLTKQMIAKLPDGSIIPSPFAVQVPTFTPDEFSECDRGIEFIGAVLADYQDSIISDSANKKTTVDPTDFAAIIRDYFETGRGGLTQVFLREWIESDFDEAFIKRQLQLNETAPMESRAVKTEAQIEYIAKAYHEHLVQLTKKDCMLPHAYLRTLRTTLNRLCELELLSMDDSCEWFLGKIETLLATDEQILVDSVG